MRIRHRISTSKMIVGYIKEKQLIEIGHVQRMSAERLSKKVMR